MFATDNYTLAFKRSNFSLVFTISFNIVLTLLISVRLVLARRAMLAMGVHIEGLASRYISTINIVVESAAIWVLPAIIHLAAMDSFHGHPHNFHGPPDFSALAPFFWRLFQITTVICYFLVLIREFIYSQALSPALLLYRIAYNMQYTPDPVGKHPGHVDPMAGQWLHNPENQIVEIDETKGCAWETNSKLSIRASFRAVMR
jgi:hypothetical protein